MKRYTVFVCFLLITTLANATEINFLENPVWSSVLAKAKKENKIIFLDAFAVWCGPCKNMDAQTYTNAAVAAYYNANFINVKYDMEKGEGPKLAELFQVTAYPSLIFINAEGKMLYKAVGFKPATSFVELGKTAKDKAAQFFELKQKAQQLSNTEFKAFIDQAKAFEDEDLAQICEQYLAKQPDILGNADLIDVVMIAANLLPSEEQLAYFSANKTKITATGKYTEAAVNDKLVGLTLGYAVSNDVQKQPNKIDFSLVKTLLEKYVPERAFFVYHYYKTQYSFEQNDNQEATKNLNILLASSPAKLSFEQACMAVMNFGASLIKAGQFQAILTQLDTVQIPEKEMQLNYLRDYVKAAFYINAKDFVNFKTVANAMLSNKNTPANLKAELQSVLEKIGN